MTVPNSADTAAYLGIAAHTLPDLRAHKRTDRYTNPAHLAQMIKQRPLQLERGGGRQNLDGRPDGAYLYAMWMHGLLAPSKRRTRPTKDPGGYAAWRYAGTITPSAIPTVLPYANPVAEAEAAWDGATVNHYAATIKQGRPPRHRVPCWSLFSCERIPRKPLQAFAMVTA